MTRATAVTALCCVACVALALSGAVHPFFAPACLLWLLFKRLVLDRVGFRFPDPVLPIGCTLLFLLFVWFALFSEHSRDWLGLLLVFATGGIVLCTLPPTTPWKDFLLVVITLWVVVGSAAVTTGLLPLFIAGAYLLTACHTLPVLTRQEDEPDDAVTVRLRERPGAWSLAPAFAAHHLALLGLLLGGLIYLVVPRLPPGAVVQAGEDADNLLARRRGRVGTMGAFFGKRTGFASEVRLGDIGRIKRSERVAFLATLRVHGKPYDPAPGDRNMLLLRANAWDAYSTEGARWIRRHGPARALGAGGLIAEGDAPVDWNLSLRGYDGRLLFLPQRTRRVRATVREMRIDRMGIVRTSDAIYNYGVEAGFPVTRREELARLRPDLRDRRLTEVPGGLALALEPHLRAVGAAARSRPRPGVILDAAQAIQRYFRDGGFRYTLELPESLPPDRDPIVAFLERREGHCELYASAACMFLRMMGVPARLAGGVRCAERLGRGEYRARMRNAHAWVEVACRGVGMVAFDFTPADANAVRATGAPGAAAQTGRDDPEEEVAAGAPPIDWSDPFRYGHREQRLLLRKLGAAVGPWVLPVLGGAAGLLLVAGLLTGARRRRVASGAVTGVRRTLGFYARWLRECARQGYRRAPSQTPREFLAALPGELRERGRPVTDAFERERYGTP